MGTGGSHQQFKHATKPGKVTVSGRPNDDVAEKTWNNIQRQAVEMSANGTKRSYAVVIERAGDNYSAFSPDVPRCIATGATVEETTRVFGEALAFHLRGLLADGDPIPEPGTAVATVEVAVTPVAAA